MRRHICLAFIAILLPLPASAEVILRSKCSLNPGKTFAVVGKTFYQAADHMRAGLKLLLSANALCFRKPGG